MGVAKYEYVVYKGEEVVASGTMREVMKQLNISIGTFSTLLATKTLEREVESYRKGKRNGQMVAIKVDVAEIERESGEIASSLSRGNKELLKDGIGDTVVTLIILAQQHGWTLEECLQYAYDEIKDRTGETRNGTFIKSDDL